MLKSLELFGFKSFADRVAFDFAEGITCVVGPNGSGKSNVVDAIKWLLGDQSPKSLRGKEMTDVIFNGSQAAKPSGFAEAILTFDNSSGLLDLETDEVRIGRRLYRGGDSEYLLNDNVVRLKDIRDLLMGTGAGLSAYNIIEQGRVGQILQANPTSRRVIFEEAAGISRFKTRKQDGERKLERVAQNLQRLQDIVDEVESQLHATRSQASKAAKYREVSQELKQWFLGLAADDYRRISSVADELNAELQTLNQSQGELHTSQQELEQQTENQKFQLEQVRRNLTDEVRMLSGLREQIADRRANYRNSESRLNDLQKQLVQTTAERNDALVALKQTREQSSAATNDLASFEESLQQQEQTFSESEQEIANIEVELQQLQGPLESRISQLRELEQTLQNADRLSQSIEDQRASLQSSREKKLDEVAGVDAELVRETDKLSELQESLERSTQVHQSGQQELDQLSHNIAELNRSNRDLAAKLAETRENRSALQARQSILHDLEVKQSGITVGVKEILERAARLQQPPWNSIIGTVADIIEVDLLDAALAEVALGERAQWIVVERLQPILDYLDRENPNIVGRVGFFSLQENSKPQFAALPNYGTLQFEQSHGGDHNANLPSEPGVLSSAETLIRSTLPSAHHLASRILGDTWVVEDLATAQRLVESKRYSARYVTLQGELIESSGAVVVGNQQVETSVISRRTELLKIKTKLNDIETVIDRIQHQISENEIRIEKNRNEQKQQQEIIQSQSSKLSEQRAEIQTQQRICDRIRDDRDRLQVSLNQFNEQVAELESKLEHNKTSLESAQRDKQTCQSEIEELNQKISQASIRRKEAAETMGRLKLDIVRDRQQRLSLVETTERLVSELTEKERRLEQLNINHSDLVDSCRYTTLKLLNTRAEFDELHAAIESRASVTSELQAQYDASELMLKQADKSLQEASKQLRDVESRVHALEMTRRDHDNDIRNLEERLAEDYQLTLDDIGNSEDSAFALYLEDRGLANQTEESESDENEEEHLADPGITFEDVREEIEESVARLRRRLKSLGNVNTDSLNDLEELEQRFEKLSGQLNDLVEAKNTLEDIVRRISHESKRLFLETYESIRENFKVLFRKMFGGGEGDVILEDPEDPLDCGIEIIARPPGKELRSISLLSGGEKTMTAVALLLAMFKSKPSPFCILDEVDAALDEANIDRYIRTLREFKDETQFVMITHRKRTMTVADRMYGVTMEQSGVSKKLTVQFEDVTDNGEIRVGGKGGTDTQAA